MQANRPNRRSEQASGRLPGAGLTKLLTVFSLLFALGCTPDSNSATAARDPKTQRPRAIRDALPIVRQAPANQDALASQEAPANQTAPANQEATASQEATAEPETPASQTVPASEGKLSPQTLIVEVHGFQSPSGQCRLALYRNAQGFNQPKLAWAKQTLDVPNQGPVLWTIELDDAPQAGSSTRWAVSAHHDKNNNDQLDKNAFGIPTEPYGFSKNPKRGFGPPAFDEACFSLGPDELQSAARIEIRVQ